MIMKIVFGNVMINYSVFCICNVDVQAVFLNYEVSYKRTSFFLVDFTLNVTFHFLFMHLNIISFHYKVLLVNGKLYNLLTICVPNF